METVRVIYKTEEGSWWAESPDLEEHWLAIAASFAEARALAEEGVPWALERDDVELEHFVHTSAIPAFAAEQQAAAKVAAAAKVY
jgi:predicted RNase H-like HicB family nuclease